MLQTAEKSGNIQIAVLIRLVAATGMRRGEAAALRWSDISFESREVIVDESVIGARGTLIVKSPKTSGSLRTVAIDEETVRVLEGLRESQLAVAENCGFALEGDAFVFSYSPDGLAPPHPDSISHGFKRIAKQAGVASDIHLHSLRHFQATVIDPIVSERQKQARLGWSTSHMARHYTDPISDEDRKVADEVGRLLDS
ncbi:MAG: site-specific integrase [Acidimicrobiaceae bacterium]|nr:site-specific integrase [Acidimicrobiaceae bacterium]